MSHTYVLLVSEYSYPVRNCCEYSIKMLIYLNHVYMVSEEGFGISLHLVLPACIVDKFIYYYYMTDIVNYAVGYGRKIKYITTNIC